MAGSRPGRPDPERYAWYTPAMVRRRLVSSLLVPVGLIGLVAVLATLQYRWLGQVSEAEREQLRRSITQRAREFADDLDADVSALYRAIETAATPGGVGSVAPALDAWRAAARYPSILRALYLAEPGAGGARLRPWVPQAGVFAAEPVPWPSQLEPVRARLTGNLRTPLPPPDGRSAFLALTLSPLVAEVPALVVPVPAAAVGAAPPRVPAGAGVMPRGAGSTMVWTQVSMAHVVAELDGEVYRTSVLPALLARHFPDADAYRVAVLDGRGAALAAQGIAPGRPADWTHGDVTLPVLAVRMDWRGVFTVGSSSQASGAFVRTMPGAPAAGAAPGVVPHAEGDAVGRLSVVIEQRSDIAGGRGAAAATSSRPSAPGVVGTQVRVARSNGAWSVVVQHAAGSLDAAVSRARTRNLWLSFGILAVLASGMVLVLINARRSEQLAARQMDFVATVSHELRTPLAVIRSAAQNLAAGVVADPAQARRYGELIDGEGRRLGDMVEQVLDYAGLEGKGRVRAPRPVDVPALVEAVATQHRPVCDAAGCALDLDLSAAPAAAAVMGDEAALGRAVGNLIQNAVKHGGDGRWIGVTVTEAPCHEGREVQVTVRDRGRGIEAADLPHLFEPFRRGRYAVAQQIHGNGLGLSLVKRIVEAHGGRVSAASAMGEGATFVIHLPVADGAAGPAGLDDGRGGTP